jgi:succinate-semialdehyde dehydrogenase/glutarate-semialdehyde dehydrogenase
MNTSDAIADLDTKHGIFIDGRGHGTDATFQVHDPATREVIAEISDGTTSEATSAVDAAARAFDMWAATPPRARADILRRAFDLMIAATEHFVALICAENGKPQADARAEVGYAAEFFRWYSEETVRAEGAYGVSPAGGTRTIVSHKPIGVAALVTPWNFPAAMATRKIAPALAAGCTVVLKPASETPLTALAIAKLLTAAGVPDGVV